MELLTDLWNFLVVMKDTVTKKSGGFEAPTFIGRHFRRSDLHFT